MKMPKIDSISKTGYFECHTRSKNKFPFYIHPKRP